MKELEKKLEILNQGMSDEMNILEDKAMNQLTGGISCKKDYIESSHGCTCMCGYVGPTVAD